MKNAFALIALAGLAAAASAQGTGTIGYQVSTDGGTTWQNGTVNVPQSQTSVMVRIQASWSADNNMYAFAGSQFDVVVSGASAGDNVANAARPFPTDKGATQTIVATRFGNQIKIDDARDTSGPGLGTRGVFPGQLVEQFAGTNFSSANPINIFTFTLNLDGTAGLRSFSNLYIAPSGGNTTDHVMRVYTSSSGGQNNPVTTTNGGGVNVVVPAPGALALLGLGAIATGRCRRSSL